MIFGTLLEVADWEVQSTLNGHIVLRVIKFKDGFAEPNSQSSETTNNHSLNSFSYILSDDEEEC